MTNFKTNRLWKRNSNFCLSGGEKGASEFRAEGQREILLLRAKAPQDCDLSPFYSETVLQMLQEQEQKAKHFNLFRDLSPLWQKGVAEQSSSYDSQEAEGGGGMPAIAFSFFPIYSFHSVLLYTHTHTRTCWFSGSSGSAYLASKRP
jgi:hypothetical protein